MKLKRFPTFPLILLIIGVIWLLNDTNIIQVNIPWVPVILIIIALGLMFNKYSK